MMQRYARAARLTAQAEKHEGQTPAHELVDVEVVRFTLVDPRENRAPTAAVRPGMREVLGTLWGIPTFRHMLYCYSVSYFFGYGILQWQPTFFVRSHGMETGELGTWFALVNGIGALLGTYIGGEWAARRAANDESAQLRVIAVAYCTFGAFSPLAAGVLSDVLRPVLGVESLRYALLALCPGYAWVGWHLWKASRTVNCDMR